MIGAARLRASLVSGTVFGAAALGVMALWFGPLLAGKHADPISWLLYAGLPGAAAAASGALLGAPLLASPGPRDARAAVLRGVVVAVVALVLFAPAYAVVLKMAEPGWSGLAGMALLVLELGGLAFGWLIAIVGGVVGWGLYRWSHSPRPSAIARTRGSSV